MALAGHTTRRRMQPMDKEASTVGHCHDLFDQYIDTHSFHLNEDVIAPSVPGDPAHFFDFPLPSKGSEPIETFPTAGWDNTRIESEESWQKALRSLHGRFALPIRHSFQIPVYPVSRGKASVSDPELLGRADLQEPSQIQSSPPFCSTPPSPSTTPYRTRDKLACYARRKLEAVRKLSRKHNTPPKMLRTSQYPGHPTSWMRIQVPAEKLHGQVMADPMMRSTSCITKISRLNGSDEVSLPGGQLQSPCPFQYEDEFLSGPTDAHDYNQGQMTPISTPATSRSASGNFFPTVIDPTASAFDASQMNGEIESLLTPPQSQRLAMETWEDESSNEEAFNFSISASPAYPPSKPQPWWSPSSVPQPYPSTYHDAKNNASALSTASTDLATSGLMIQCNSAPMHGLQAATSFTALSPLLHSTFAYPTTLLMPPTKNMQQTTPSSRSSSTSPPPAGATPRTRRSSRGSSKPRSSHHRRKSANCAVPRHAASMPGTLGFVNFTPEDSKKILTGVAPSGSSKTKARREREAAEKRRKLSEAATRVILEAGGDISALEREGLL